MIRLPSVVHRLHWMSDIHLECCGDPAVQRVRAALPGEPGDAVAITGDIGTGADVDQRLRWLAETLPVPILFVLGNHDYYHGSLPDVRKRVRSVTEAHPNLHWLTHSPPIQLNRQTVAVGHDGWADAGFGDFQRSRVELNDYYLIAEFAGRSRAERRALMRSQAVAAVEHLQIALANVPPDIRQVIICTHVPPFAEVCLAPDRRPANPEWLPHFTNRVLGEFLVEYARRRPPRRILVLCGHTHTRAAARPAPQLEVRVAGAAYGQPRVEEVVELSA